MQFLSTNLKNFIIRINYKHDGFPQWYEFGFQDHHGNTALMYWCRYRLNDPIPLELLQEITIQDNYGLTALMYWITRRKWEPIPSELLRELHLFDPNHWTPLMYWCRYRREPIPSELLIHVGHRDVLGRMAASLWRQSNRGKPLPDCLKSERMLFMKYHLIDCIKNIDYHTNGFPQWYEFGFQDRQGHTALIYWIMYKKDEPIPPELLQELRFRDNKGRTPLMFWCRYRNESVPPELLIHLGYQTAKGNTASTIWKQSNPNKPLPECLKPEETMELIPFTPHEYRSKILDFKLI